MQIQDLSSEVFSVLESINGCMIPLVSPGDNITNEDVNVDVYNGVIHNNWYKIFVLHINTTIACDIQDLILILKNCKLKCLQFRC